MVVIPGIQMQLATVFEAQYDKVTMTGGFGLIYQDLYKVVHTGQWIRMRDFSCV